MRPRRHNPDYLNLAMLGALGVGLYALYQFIRSAPAAVPKALSNASSTVADWAEKLFPYSTASLVTGATILLGTGAEIPASYARGVGAFTDVDGTQKFQFFYDKQIWRTTTGTPDETNTYYATAVGS